MDRERYMRLLSALLSDWPKLESSVQRLAHSGFSWRILWRPCGCFGWTVFRLGFSNAADHFFGAPAPRASGSSPAWRQYHAVLATGAVRAERGIRIRPANHRARAGLALRARGIAADRRRSGGALGGAGRRDRYRKADRVYRATSARVRDFVRRNAEATSATGGVATAARVSQRTGALSVWAGRLQVRLGAGRADSMEGG